MSNNSRCKKSFDVNLRAILAFRDLEKEQAGLETFCGYMNMTETAYKITLGCLIEGETFISFSIFFRLPRALLRPPRLLILAT